MSVRSQFYDPDLITHLDPLSHVSETIKIIRTNVEFSSIDKPLKSIAVTSTNQSEGKSVIIANLAITYAQAGRRVLLVDADLRRPMLHRLFGMSNRRGMTNVLLSDQGYEAFVQETLTDNLFVLTTGPVPPNPAEMLMSTSFATLMETLKQSFDMVFVDAPPIAVVTDAALISTKVDGMIYVVRSGEVERKQLQHATQLLKQVKANVIGYVLNGVPEDSQYYYYYYAKQQQYGLTENTPRSRTRRAKKNDNPFYQTRKSRRRQPLPVLRAPVLPDPLTNGQEKPKMGSINHGIASEDD